MFRYSCCLFAIGFSLLFNLALNASAAVSSGAVVWAVNLEKGISNGVQQNIYLNNKDPYNSTLGYGCAINNTNLFVVGTGYQIVGTIQYPFFATLWTLNSAKPSNESVKQITLSKTLGTRASGCAVNSTNCYIVGPQDALRVPGATLWITNLNGDGIQQITLDTGNSFAYSCSVNQSNCFIAGYGINQSIPNQGYGVATLWITKADGSGVSPYYLSSALDSSASGCALDASHCYVVGSDIDPSDPTRSSFRATFWVTDLVGNASAPVNLDTSSHTYAASCSVTSSHCYSVGVGSNSKGLGATLWITNLDGTGKQTISLASDGYACSCFINGSKCYIVGSSTSSKNNYLAAMLWIVNLDGTIAQTVVLDTLKNSIAYGCAVNDNYCYVVGFGLTTSQPARLERVTGFYSPMKPL